MTHLRTPILNINSIQLRHIRTVRTCPYTHHPHPNPCYPALTCTLTTDRDISQNLTFREEKTSPFPQNSQTTLARISPSDSKADQVPISRFGSPSPMLWGGPGAGLKSATIHSPPKPQSMLPCTHVHLNNRPQPFPKPSLSRKRNFAFPTNFSNDPLRKLITAIRILTQSQYRASSHPSPMLWGGAGGGVEIRDHPLTTQTSNHATLLSRAP